MILDDPERFFLQRSTRKTPKKLMILDPTKSTVTMTTRGNAYRHTKTGFRADIDVTCRSGWEANCMRVLKSFNIRFEFEPVTFFFPVKRGIKGYIPDIYLPKTNEYIEVKGFFDDASRIKLKRFRKYYPDEFAQLTMIIGKSSRKARDACDLLEVPHVLYYEDVSKIFRSKITNWEGR